MEKATFGAGCFWGVEEIFSNLRGVTHTCVGYMGGNAENPAYQDVCTGKTGHAEVVQVGFDPSKISFERLAQVFFDSHDPTQINRQGPDTGTQYRSVVFYHSEPQRETAEELKAVLEKSGKYKQPVATQIVPAQTFWHAEEYHQKYLEKQGLSGCHIKT